MKFDILIKRLFDIVFSLLLLIIFLPASMIFSIMIKITSPGPIFFLQKRPGQHKKLFVVYKFRTMKPGSEKMTKGQEIMKDDSRVTSIGKFLRRSKIDEIPQVINVLKGEMSLIGPRPERIASLEDYDDEISKRLHMKPGITGLAQVSGNIYLDLKERYKYDIYYVENYSLLLDIQIIVRTIAVILLGENHYINKPLINLKEDNFEIVLKPSILSESDRNRNIALEKEPLPNNINQVNASFPIKKILITGTDSYIGTTFENWLSKWPDKYIVKSIDMRDGKWQKDSFEGYDAVLHVAAIVHVKEDSIDKYFKINRDLAYETAEKAKKEGVKQFIFLSTMGVYGDIMGYINKDSLPKPKTPYAKSKYEAEILLSKLNDNIFNVAILRPPIVYGKNCRGNYPRLSRIAKKLYYVPHLKNERSMIYVDNLSEFIRLIIDTSIGGLLFPQNADYVNTTELMYFIAKAHKKNIKKAKVLNWIIYLGLHFSGTFRKVFGSFAYDKKLPGGPDTIINGQKLHYETISFEESIMHSEEV